VTEKVRLYEKCDPKRLEEINKNKKVCKDSVNRWTDNLYEVEGWIKKNNAAVTTEQLHENFPILKDLDYI